MILRKVRGDFEKVKTKRIAPQERHYEDADLEWKSGTSHFRVYILDAHETFDPMTSSHGRHNYRGPGVVINNDHGGGSQCDEYHVNDPIVWAWIGRCIREGHLTPGSILSPSNEKEYKQLAGRS